MNMIIFSIASAAGFLMALLFMAGIRQRLEISPVPKPLQGTAITLITAGLLALAFFGFIGVDASLTTMKE